MINVFLLFVVILVVCMLIIVLIYLIKLNSFCDVIGFEIFLVELGCFMAWLYPIYILYWYSDLYGILIFVIMLVYGFKTGSF